MCILFLHTDSSPSLNNKYKLILAANRDEYYSRPSKEAHFWECQPTVVGGTDAEPGKEGGTWIGMSTTGKVGALLNMPPKPNTIKSQKLGRGFLVTDYLQSNLNGVEYGNQLKSKNAAKLYHSFNLLTIDLNSSDKENGLAISYFSNYSPLLLNENKSDAHLNDHYQITLGSDGIYSFGNCAYSAPLLKIKDGEKRFTRLVETCGQGQREEDEQLLIDGLLDILKSPQKHYPDPELQTMALMRSEEFAKGISSRFVHMPWRNYGSRTHTIILVDKHDHVKYFEWTMKEPILDPLNAEWTNSKHEFHIQDQDC